ncbi:MAG: hypothetical protein H6607_07760 [Flavobacteriales bacterium]|nr:hypothetical protein [Flavobacteriales bacterium]
MLEEINEKWKAILANLEKQFGKKMDMNAVLLVIGIRELGTLKAGYTKEEKVRLMHIAVCRLFSKSGFYQLTGINKKGWPEWKKIKDLPFADVFEQEALLRQHIVEYFEDEEIYS